MEREKEGGKGEWRKGKRSEKKQKMRKEERK